MTWEVNKVGAMEHYGRRVTQREGLRASVSQHGVIKEMRVPFSYDNLDIGVGNIANDDRLAMLPAKSFLESAYIIVDQAFAGGTSLNFGFVNSAGSEIDYDGIDASVALAAMDAAGDIIKCDGADIGTVVHATSDAYLYVAATGTYTAGTATLVLRYIDGDALPQV